VGVYRHCHIYNCLKDVLHQMVACMINITKRTSDLMQLDLKVLECDLQCLGYLPSSKNYGQAPLRREDPLVARQLLAEDG
jgi:hypothetical protein